MQTNLKIPRVLINSPEELLQQKILNKYDGYENIKLTRADEATSYPAIEKALLKYYPKYCYRIRLGYDPKPWPVVSRIKQIKSIRHFEYDLNKSLVFKTLEKLLKNKRKCIKSLPTVGFSEELSCRIRHLTPMEMCYFFSQIETLNVRLEVWCSSSDANQDFIPAYLEDRILDEYGHFWDVLKHVKHLYLDFNQNLWVILPHLEKAQRFLASLQSFSLTIFSHRIDATDNPRKKFLSFLRTPDVLKYITHIKFIRFLDKIEIGQFHYYGDEIKSILDCCSRLQSIIFPIETEFYSSQTQFAENKRYLTLAPLQSLNRLSSLELMVHNAWSMVKGFEFPPQLKRLALRLYRLESIMEIFETKNEEEPENLSGQEDSPEEDKEPEGNENREEIEGSPSQEESQQSEGSPEEYQESEEEEESLDEMKESLDKFFEKICRLTELKVLEFKARMSNEVLKNIFVPMLQAVPKIEKLEFEVYKKYRRDPPIPLNLSLIFNEAIPLSQLRSFKMFQEMDDDDKLSATYLQIITFNPDVHQQTVSFPNMTSFNINGLISEDFDFRTFFRAFSDNSKRKEINLAKIHVLSIQSLLKLLKIFKEAEQFPSLKIYLDLELYLEGWEDIDKYLEKTIILAKNATIHLKIEISSSEETHPPSERIIKLQKVFAKMRFTLVQIAKRKKVRLITK